MLCRLALWTLLAALCACDAPPRGTESIQPAAQNREPAAALSKQQAYELSEQCAQTSRDEFRRAWREGAVNTADGQMTADFTNHYNAKLNTCFYLLTVNRYTNDNSPGSASTSTLSKMLFDTNGGELYGEYLGPATTESPPAGFPTTCRVESLYCASEREWEVLVERYMED